MNKKQYVVPEIEIIELNTEDIITTSDPNKPNEQNEMEQVPI